MKYIFLFIFSVLLLGCNNQRKLDCENFKSILKKESSLVIELDDTNSTIYNLVEFVRKEKCNGINMQTGFFEIGYNINKRIFTPVSNKQNCRIGFLGYKCPNSLLDFFYKDLLIFIDNNKKCFLQQRKPLPLDSIEKKVHEHIGLCSVYGENSRILLVLPIDMDVREISGIIGEILLGYRNLLNEHSLLIFESEFCELHSDQVKILKEKIPLNIALTYNYADE